MKGKGVVTLRLHWVTGDLSVDSGDAVVSVRFHSCRFPLGEMFSYGRNDVPYPGFL